MFDKIKVIGYNLFEVNMKNYFIVFIILLLNGPIFSQEKVSFIDIDTDDKILGEIFIELKSYNNVKLRKSVFNKLSRTRRKPEIFKKIEGENIYYYFEGNSIYDDASSVDIMVVTLKLFDAELNDYENIPKNYLNGLGISINDEEYFSKNLEEMNEVMGKELDNNGSDDRGKYQGTKLFLIGDSDNMVEYFNIFYARVVSTMLDFIDTNDIERALYYYLMDL
ncbi:hypothetical protein FACS189491_04270 [Spirochaetia bacterium]|nr:hypothetical protein FACS189491_04270 [Spirochaetia bacterium]